MTYAARGASAFSIATVAATAGLAFAACHLVGGGIQFVPELVRSCARKLYGVLML